MSKANEDIEHYETLSAEAESQRARFFGLLGLARERVRPANLMKEAENRALDMGLDALDKSAAFARAYPLRVAGMAAAVGALLARKPLWKLLGSTYSALRQRGSDRIETPGSGQEE
mgnify:CR=1 FL=1|tara:strand:- start:18902 stop:19249 length:348 start_codon:yes stop_codon:yes gene_type:complete